MSHKENKQKGRQLITKMEHRKSAWGNEEKETD